MQFFARLKLKNKPGGENVFLSYPRKMTTNEEK